MIAYVDSSVLLRVAFGESNRLSEWKLISQPIASTLLHVESWRALDRVRLAKGSANEYLRKSRATLQQLLEGFDFLEITPAVLVRASQPFDFKIGSLHAIHLATAIQWHAHHRETLRFATHDDALAEAARSVGFEVLGA